MSNPVVRGVTNTAMQAPVPAAGPPVTYTFTSADLTGADGLSWWGSDVVVKTLGSWVTTVAGQLALPSLVTDPTDGDHDLYFFLGANYPPILDVDYPDPNGVFAGEQYNYLETFAMSAGPTTERHWVPAGTVVTLVIVSWGGELVPFDVSDQVACWAALGGLKQSPFYPPPPPPVQHEAVLTHVDGDVVWKVLPRTLGTGTSSDVGGYRVEASGVFSHAEGKDSRATEFCAHAEGSTTLASGFYAHAEGSTTIASGWGSHAEGELSHANGQAAHAEGSVTEAPGPAAHAEGALTEATAQAAHAEGSGTHAIARYAHAEGDGTIASGEAAHAEGYATVANGAHSHTEGAATNAAGTGAHAEGYSTSAGGTYAHAEGQQTTASGNYAHAEGQQTTAGGNEAHAEGGYTLAQGDVSHAQGWNTSAMGTASSAQGIQGWAFRLGQHAHGGGMFSGASPIQESKLVMGAVTVNAAPVNLHLGDFLSGLSIQTFELRDNCLSFLKGSIVARSATGTPGTSVWTYNVVADITGGTLIASSYDLTVVSQTGDGVNWDVSVGGFALAGPQYYWIPAVTGTSAATVRWTVTVDLVEVSDA